MSDKRVPTFEPDRRLTLARVTEILVNGVLVGACLAIALLAATMVARILVATVGQMVFEDGIVLLTVIGLFVALAMRLAGNDGFGSGPEFFGLDWRLDLAACRAWDLIRWLGVALGVALIVAGSLIVAPTVLSPGTSTAIRAANSATANAPQVRVVVAKRALTPHTVLTTDNVELGTVPDKVMQPNVETDINNVIGKALVVPVGNGQQILANIITGQSTRFVVVAKRTLAANTTLTADDVQIQTVDSTLFVSTAETSLQDVIGKVLLVPAVVNQQMLAPMLADTVPVNPLPTPTGMQHPRVWQV